MDDRPGRRRATPVGAGSGDVEQLRLRRPQRQRHHRSHRADDHVTGQVRGGTTVRRRRRRTAGRTGRRPRHRRAPARSLAGPCRHPTQFDLQHELVAGHHLTAESRPVEAAEQRQLAGELRIGEHRCGTDLGDRLAHQHARAASGDRGSARRRTTRRRSAATAPTPTPRARSRSARRRTGTAVGAAAVRRVGAVRWDRMSTSAAPVGTAAGVGVVVVRNRAQRLVDPERSGIE